MLDGYPLAQTSFHAINASQDLALLLNLKQV